MDGRISSLTARADFISMIDQLRRPGRSGSVVSGRRAAGLRRRTDTMFSTYAIGARPVDQARGGPGGREVARVALVKITKQIWWPAERAMALECGGLTPLSAAGPDPPSPALRRRLSPSGAHPSSFRLVQKPALQPDRTGLIVLA
jgi:hypothetical protein